MRDTTNIELNLDKAGYPTEKSLIAIATWKTPSLYQMMKAIKTIWWMPDFGFGKESLP